MVSWSQKRQRLRRLGQAVGLHEPTAEHLHGSAKRRLRDWGSAIVNEPQRLVVALLDGGHVGEAGLQHGWDEHCHGNTLLVQGVHHGRRVELCL